MKITITEEQLKNIITEYITQDMVSLKQYLSQTEEQRKSYLPEEYPYFFYDFIDSYNNYHEFEGFKDELEGYELIEVVEYVKNNNPKIYSKYADYLYDKIEQGELDVPYSEYPAWSFFDNNPTVVKNQWLIHFTNNADDIAKNGFKYGVDEMTKLGLTTHLSDFDKKYGGYNFAYLLSDFDNYGRANRFSRNGEYKYGKEAVLFIASGIKTYHYGDEEPQVIFYGNTAKNIIPIRTGENDSWAIYSNKTGKIIIESDSLEKIVYWIGQNYQQYYKTLR